MTYWRAEQEQVKFGLFCISISFRVLHAPESWSKYVNICIKAERNYFDQQMACRAPIRWSKYTTPEKARESFCFFLSGQDFFAEYVDWCMMTIQFLNQQLD